MSVPSLDQTKGNWTLRVVSDESKTESIELTKDRERVEHIKAIKKAWETADLGRCDKVTQKL